MIRLYTPGGIEHSFPNDEISSFEFRNFMGGVGLQVYMMTCTSFMARYDFDVDDEKDNYLKTAVQLSGWMKGLVGACDGVNL